MGSFPVKILLLNSINKFLKKKIKMMDQNFSQDQSRSDDSVRLIPSSERYFTQKKLGAEIDKKKQQFIKKYFEKCNEEKIKSIYQLEERKLHYLTIFLQKEKNFQDPAERKKIKRKARKKVIERLNLIVNSYAKRFRKEQRKKSSRTVDIFTGLYKFKEDKGLLNYVRKEIQNKIKKICKSESVGEYIPQFIKQFQLSYMCIVYALRTRCIDNFIEGFTHLSLSHIDQNQDREINMIKYKWHEGMNEWQKYKFEEDSSETHNFLQNIDTKKEDNQNLEIDWFSNSWEAQMQTLKWTGFQQQSLLIYQ